jgi:nicotinamidase-related amidase
VDKVAYSAFAHTRLDWLLRRFRCDHIVVAGIVTNGGVASTVHDAHVREYGVTVLTDGCASFDEVVHSATLTSLASTARLTTCDEFVASLPRPS